MKIIKAISEYLDIVKKGIENKDQIIESIRNAAKIKNGSISDEELAEILRRREICEGCEFNSVNAKKLNNYNSYLPFTHCVLCRCRIGEMDAKEACLSCNCGIDAFNKANPHLPPRQPKWTAYNQNQQ